MGRVAIRFGLCGSCCRSAGRSSVALIPSLRGCFGSVRPLRCRCGGVNRARFVRRTPPRCARSSFQRLVLPLQPTNRREAAPRYADLAIDRNQAPSAGAQLGTVRVGDAKKLSTRNLIGAASGIPGEATIRVRKVFMGLSSESDISRLLTGKVPKDDPELGAVAGFLTQFRESNPPAAVDALQQQHLDLIVREARVVAATNLGSRPARLGARRRLAVWVVSTVTALSAAAGIATALGVEPIRTITLRLSPFSPTVAAEPTSEPPGQPSSISPSGTQNTSPRGTSGESSFSPAAVGPSSGVPTRTALPTPTAVPSPTVTPSMKPDSRGTNGSAEPRPTESKTKEKKDKAKDKKDKSEDKEDDGSGKSKDDKVKGKG